MNFNLLRVAVAQYSLSSLRNWEEYRCKLTQWVSTAAEQGAKLLIFPEYSSIELVSLLAPGTAQSLSQQLAGMQSWRADFLLLFSHLANSYQVHICAGSYPVHATEHSYYNRSDFFWPAGQTDYQDKLQITPFERDTQQIQSGQDAKVFATQYGKMAINICYDSEFPLIARNQVEQGAIIILTPSCTETLAGYYRVQIGCQARALENQCYVLHASIVGEWPWNALVDTSVGAAAVYTPPDHGFPDQGILAIGELNQPQWVYADLDIAAIDQVRSYGQVLNYRDWDEQFTKLSKILSSSRRLD